MPAKELNIGVLASNKHRLNELVLLVQSTGERLGAALDVPNCNVSSLPSVDVWVADVDLEDSQGQELISQIDDRNVPLVYGSSGDEIATPSNSEAASSEHRLLPHQVRQARAQKLRLKLKSSVAEASKVQSIKSLPARELWVLAASTGGPAAVVEFLEALPASVPGIAFLYVQHIEGNGEAVLHQTIERASALMLRDTEQAHVMVEASITVASALHQLELLDGGIVAGSTESWQGIYSPSIDQVIAKVARTYGAKGGAIIFTGMGDDGAFGANMLRHRGGKVWAQSPASCAVDSMPVSAIAKGCVSYEGDPRALAAKLAAYANEKYDQAEMVS